MQSFDRLHGRDEARMTRFIALDSTCFEERWHNCGLVTLMVVERHRIELKTGQRDCNTRYYLSNLPPQAREVALHCAIRGHWSVEVHNHVRDVTFEEDDVRIRDANQAHIFSLLLSTAIRLIKRLNPPNIKAALERFADVPAACHQALLQLGFL